MTDSCRRRKPTGNDKRRTDKGIHHYKPNRRAGAYQVEWGKRKRTAPGGGWGSCRNRDGAKEHDRRLRRGASVKREGGLPTIIYPGRAELARPDQGPASHAGGANNRQPTAREPAGYRRYGVRREGAHIRQRENNERITNTMRERKKERNDGRRGDCCCCRGGRECNEVDMEKMEPGYRKKEKGKGGKTGNLNRAPTWRGVGWGVSTTLFLVWSLPFPTLFQGVGAQHRWRGNVQDFLNTRFSVTGGFREFTST
ncbi:hypothetical protein ES705_27026 [subsurface metagenome]